MKDRSLSQLLRMQRHSLPIRGPTNTIRYDATVQNIHESLGKVLGIGKAKRGVAATVLSWVAGYLLVLRQLSLSGGGSKLVVVAAAVFITVTRNYYNGNI